MFELIQVSAVLPNLTGQASEIKFRKTLIRDFSYLAIRLIGRQFGCGK